MKYVAAIFILIFVQKLFAEQKTWDNAIESIITKNQAFEQVINRMSVKPLIDVTQGEIIRLTENYGWGMRIITLYVNSDSSNEVTIDLAQILPGKPDVILSTRSKIDVSDIINQIRSIRESAAFNVPFKEIIPPVIDSSTVLIEIKSKLDYRWFFRGGFSGDNNFNGRDVIDSFTKIEARIAKPTGSRQ